MAEFNTTSADSPALVNILTTGGYEANSYASISYANEYFASRLHTNSWDTAVVADRTKALAMATRSIDRLSLTGDKPTGQENHFPVDGATEIPDDIKIACCEEALSLLDGVEPDKLLEDARVAHQGYESVRVTYNEDNVPEHVLSMIASPVAWTYLRPYLRDPGNVKLCRVS